MASMSLLVHVNENSCRKLSIYESVGGFVITVFVLYVHACCSSTDRMLLSLQKCTLRGIKDKRWNKWFLTQGKCRHSCIMALCDKKERENVTGKLFQTHKTKALQRVSCESVCSQPIQPVSHSYVNLQAFIYITHSVFWFFGGVSFVTFTRVLCTCVGKWFILHHKRDS